jgi:tRNA wybutosine-synthesizing protein 2
MILKSHTRSYPSGDPFNMTIEVGSSRWQVAPDSKMPPKPKPANPIQTAIKSWFSQLPKEVLGLIKIHLEELLLSAPKRWVVYPPMVLLPSGSFDEEWWSPFGGAAPPGDVLWGLILEHISKREGKGVLSHLAINSGIPLHQVTENEGSENILRTPSGLIMLRGDFGPALLPSHSPSDEDFENAFWVSTKQNGITQIWAPRYTMFSRGNIKEKARLLDFHGPSQKISSRVSTEEDIKGRVAVDLYAGIGYFVFSYVKMGMKQVVGWELNPWSVEGLRRGAEANGWSVKVVKPGEEFKIRGERIVVFLEDNMKAEGRQGDLGFQDVTHVNCGLLPSSEDSWKTAMGCIAKEGWLHLHENVDVDGIEARRVEIEAKFGKWLGEMGSQREGKVEHVELVKTFAPGVWHCVFDLKLSSL